MPATHETDPARKVLFVFRDHPDQREALEQRAIREQTTPSDIMRRALAHYLEDNSCTSAGRPSVTKQGSSDGESTRLLVNDDRTVLVTLWPTGAQVANRDHASHTWGPPVDLKETS